MAATARAMVDAGRTTDLFDIQQDEGKQRPTSKVWARALGEEDELTTQLFDAAIDAIVDAAPEPGPEVSPASRMRSP